VIALTDRRWSEANEYAARTADVLNACADPLDKAAGLLKP
jgi:hypothetical protein